MQDLTEAELSKLDQRCRNLSDPYAFQTRFIIAELRVLRAENGKLRKQVEALAKFKTYVHQRLDEAGIPTDPDSPHKAEGCRVGGRLDIALAQFKAYSDFAQSPLHDPDPKSRVPDLGEVPPDESLSIVALADPTTEECERQGAWAYSFGKDRDANPYSGGDWQGQWFNGWDDAQRGDEG